MPKLPTRETIERVSDVAQLRGFCIALVGLYEKEEKKKKEYRSGATVLKQQLESKKLEN